MYKKITPLILIFFVSLNLFSQKEKGYRFGILKHGEREMTTFDKDSTANAVVLFESGNTQFNDRNYRFYIETTYYKKIKIINKEGFDYANINIPLYNNEDRYERVKDIKAITHNINERIYLKKESIFKNKLNKNHSEVVFTMPNIKEGSTIEYQYTLVTPFLFNFTGWNFQTDIPKIKSEFYATIPGNFYYNRSLMGTLKLVKNTSTIIKDCFYMQGVGHSNCEEVYYTMENIPAFHEEDFMTSKKNFLSAIKFELAYYLGFDGIKKQYTSTWKDIVKDFKKDKDIGGQLKKIKFFTKNLPSTLINESDDLKKATAIYKFIQNHYSWNEKYNVFYKVNVKKAYESKVGTVAEINISLINALNAGGLDAKLGLISTRENGFPTKIYPVMSDFNYCVARIKIGEKIYLLDATEKSLPFGILPFRCLNQDVRIIDFKTEGEWETITPVKTSNKKIQLQILLNEENNFEGKMRIISNGYSGITKRKKLNAVSEEKYINTIEDKNDTFEINEYKNTNLDDLEKILIEEFELSIDTNISSSDKLFLNPFFIDKIKENPFKLKERSYPVDFGYPKSFNYILSLDIGDRYEIESLPEEKSMKLPNNQGAFKYSIKISGSKVNIHFSYSLYNSYFYSDTYPYLKEFFKQIILSQNEPIILKKIR